MSASFRRLLVTVFCALACGTVLQVARAAEEKEAKETKSQFDVPDGTPKELLAFIKKMQKLPAQGTTRRERMDHLRNVNQAIVTAAERITEAKVDDDTAVEAVRAELASLSMLKRLSDKDATAKLDALTDKLKNDKRPALAHMLKLMSLLQTLEKLQANDTEAVESFLAEAKDFLAKAAPEAQMVPVAQATAVLMFQSGKQAEATELGQQFARGLAKNESPEAAIGTAQIADLVGKMLQAQGKDKEAGEFYREFADRFSASDDPTLRQVGAQFDSSARKLELIGQSMPISGKLVDGGKFDIAQYKGKVVLVDFWATWCGPCVAELPNVKETYDKFHDRGFEVVGISLDEQVDALTKFIDEKQIPWPILFDGGEETSGWNHPLAKKYGVTAIPMAVLINREGKVVTLSARGEKLGELVAELLGVKESDEAGAGSKQEKKAG